MKFGILAAAVLATTLQAYPAMAQMHPVGPLSSEDVIAHNVVKAKMLANGFDSVDRQLDGKWSKSISKEGVDGEATISVFESEGSFTVTLTWKDSSGARTYIDVGEGRGGWQLDDQRHAPRPTIWISDSELLPLIKTYTDIANGMLTKIAIDLGVPVKVERN
jgi:hypothetical protein